MFRSITHVAKRYYKYLFAIKMVFFSVIALGSYIFDGYFFMIHAIHGTNPGRFEGLISTILIIFAYMQYCIPIRQKLLLTLYFLFLWILHIAGHIGYLIGFVYLKNTNGIAAFCVWILGNTIYTMGLIYYRVILGRYHHIQIKNKHIFHFISQLEIILAIYISVYGISNINTISRSSVAFFLLFDFFTEDYDHFHGLLIKIVLHVFVAFVTASVALEFIYISIREHVYEYVSYLADVISFYFFVLFIFLQFHDANFKQKKRSRGQAHSPPTISTTTLARTVPKPAYTKTTR